MTFDEALAKLKNASPLRITVSGDIGSGKSTFTKDITSVLTAKGYKCVHLSTDDGYRDFSHLSIEQRKQLKYGLDGLSFDHPDAVDFKSLQERLVTIKEGLPLEFPKYDFTNHSYLGSESVIIEPNRDFVFMEGIFALDESLLSLYSTTIFVDTPEMVAFSRRVKRDMKERKRSLADIRKQYYSTVKACQRDFVLPTIKKVKHVVNWDKPKQDLEESVTEMLEHLLSRL